MNHIFWNCKTSEQVQQCGQTEKKKKVKEKTCSPVGNRTKEFFMLLSHFTDGPRERKLPGPGDPLT